MNELTLLNDRRLFHEISVNKWKHIGYISCKLANYSLDYFDGVIYDGVIHFKWGSITWNVYAHFYLDCFKCVETKICSKACVSSSLNHIWKRYYFEHKKNCMKFVQLPERGRDRCIWFHTWTNIRVSTLQLKNFTKEKQTKIH